MGCEQGGMAFKLNGSRRWSRSLVTDVTGRVDRLASNRNQDGGKDGGGSLQFLSLFDSRQKPYGCARVEWRAS